ncbi:cytosine permease [Pelagibacterales bacterium SAG-MED39]|nr:cytosine permease [Pelagibacterales bacterium SAG-MED39]
MNQQKSKNSLINWDLVSVNPNDKNWNWKDLFCFWGVNIQSVIAFSLIASLYTVYNLNTFVIFFGTLSGAILVYFFSNLIGKPSQKYGLPFVVLLRSSFGLRGAKYFGLIRSLVGIFLFGIQTYFLSKAFSYLIRIMIFYFDSSLLGQEYFLIFLLGMNIIDWISVFFTIIFQFLLFSKGMNFNKRLIKISALAVYSGIILFFFVVLLNDVKITMRAFIELLNFDNFLKKENFGPLITVTGTMFAYFSIIILTFGDFSRYVKDSKQLNKGNLSLILNLIIFSFFAVFIVTGVDVFLNENPDNIGKIFTNPTDMIGKLDNLLITILSLIFIVIASASTNLIANLIPSQYSLINFAPSFLNLKSATLIIIFLGFLISIFWLSFLSQIGILSLLDTFGALFGPIFGIMISDFYFVKKENLINKDLYTLEKDGSYYFTAGWHIKAVYSLIVGFIFSAATIWNVNLMFLQSYSWIIGAIVAAFVYYLLVKK